MPGKSRGTSVAALARQRARIARQLAEIDRVLPGTVTERLGRCGKAACCCHAEPAHLHGPYISWTRKVDAKTVTRLFSQEQWRDYRPWFENTRKLRNLLAELESLSLQELEADPRWRQK